MEGEVRSSLAMEDQLNNNFAAVPDWLLPDLDPTSLYSLGQGDDQAVPVVEQAESSTIDAFIGASWQPNDAADHTFEQFVDRSQDGAIPTSSSFPPTTVSSSTQGSGVGTEWQAAVTTSTSTTSDVTSLHCSVCFRTFKHKLSLTNHQRSHSARQPYACVICGETFKYKTIFKRHRRGHVREMKICKYCGQNMDSDYDLVQHEKEHRRQQKQL